MQYQVGDLMDFKEDDPVYEKLVIAQEMALKDSGIFPVGVWTGQEHGSELIAIAYERELFTK